MKPQTLAETRPANYALKHMSQIERPRRTDYYLLMLVICLSWQFTLFACYDSRAQQTAGAAETTVTSHINIQIKHVVVVEKFRWKPNNCTGFKINSN